MDLTKFFVDFALLGAEWVLWLLVALSVVSIGVMIDRALWFRARDADTELFTRELKGAFERGELEHVKKKHGQSTAIPVMVALRGLDEVGHGTPAIADANVTPCDGGFIASFTLPGGAYATAVMREVMKTA